MFSPNKLVHMYIYINLQHFQKADNGEPTNGESLATSTSMIQSIRSSIFRLNHEVDAQSEAGRILKLV